MMDKIFQNKSNLTPNELEFAIFCIENIAVELSMEGKSVYRLLVGQNNILDDYIIANYEMLHTQSKEYIIEDIIEYMRELGVVK